MCFIKSFNQILDPLSKSSKNRGGKGQKVSELCKKMLKLQLYLNFYRRKFDDLTYFLENINWKFENIIWKIQKFLCK